MEWDFTLWFVEASTVDVSTLEQAGCRDAAFGLSNGLPFGDFTREAPTQWEAIKSAVADTEAAGLVVSRIDTSLPGSHQLTLETEMTTSDDEIWYPACLCGRWSGRSDGYPTMIAATTAWVIHDRRER